MSRGAGDVLIVVYAVGLLVAGWTAAMALFPMFTGVAALHVPPMAMAVGGILAFAVIAWRLVVLIKARRAVPAVAGPDTKHD